MKAQDYINEYQEEERKINKLLQASIDDKEFASKWFSKQVGAIQAIKKTEGYKEIKQYFTRVLIANQDYIMKSTGLGGEKFKENAFQAAIEMKLANEFLNFLGNLESESL